MHHQSGRGPLSDPHSLLVSSLNEKTPPFQRLGRLAGGLEPTLVPVIMAVIMLELAMLFSMNWIGMIIQDLVTVHGVLGGLHRLDGWRKRARRTKRVIVKVRIE